ncbi:MAG TPA: hypothetical protein VID03_11685 [Acidimicrobiia bacterium]|jgi:photosystem II stability/assembly factor-like uncharacterized protein
MTALAIGTEKGGFLWRNGELTGPLFKGWKVSAWGRAPDGQYLAGLASNWFGASVHRSPDLETWEQVENGPSYEEGRKLNQIWTFCTSDSKVWAGVDEAGLFVSADSGLSWDPVPAFNEHSSRGSWSPGAGGLCAHHVLVDGDRIWVAASAVGVFRSDDGGQTFGRYDEGVPPGVTPDEDDVEEFGYCVHALAADPSRADLIWRQDHKGVFRTSDAGAHWEQIEKGLPANFGFVMVRDASSGALFTVPLEADVNRLPVDGDLAAYRSFDDGDSWERAGSGWPEGPHFTGVLRKSAATDGNGGVWLGTTGGDVYETTDAGDTWRALPFSVPRILSMAVL